MQIQKKQAVAFFVALNFTKAGDWDNTKLTAKLTEAPSKLTNDMVPKEFSVFFNSIQVAVKTKDAIEIVDTSAAEPAKKADAKPAAKPETKPAAKPEAKPAAKADAKKPAAKADAKTEAKPAAKKSAAPEKKTKAEPKKDKFGALEGSLRSAIYGALKPAWQSEEEIAKAANVEEDQARRRLRHSVATQPELFEKRTRVEYRLKK